MKILSIPLENIVIGALLLYFSISGCGYKFIGSQFFPNLDMLFLACLTENESGNTNCFLALLKQCNIAKFISTVINNKRFLNIYIIIPIKKKKEITILMFSDINFRFIVMMIGVTNPLITTTYTKILHNNGFFKLGNFKCFHLDISIFLDYIILL